MFSQLNNFVKSTVTMSTTEEEDKAATSASETEEPKAGEETVDDSKAGAASETEETEIVFSTEGAASETEEPPKPKGEETVDDSKVGEEPKPEAEVTEETPVVKPVPKKDSDELTKRLQKLALQRQSDNKGDRLKVIQADHESHLSSAKTFQELNLPQYLLDAVFGMGFDRPSAIQEEALPRILANPPRNLIGQAQSGSGKTAAFTLGCLFRIQVDSPSTVQALIVSPTRELAIQIVDKAVRPMAANMKGLKIELAIAGANVGKGSKLDAHMVVGTPGKIVEWLKRKVMDTRNIKVFVLDEADTMVEEGGHRANSSLIKKAMPKTCQSLFFSATFPPEVVEFAAKMVEKPDKILIEAGPEFLVRTSRYTVDRATREVSLALPNQSLHC
jgi:ATP-dependent RNA helicase DDX19/DBP5